MRTKRLRMTLEAVTQLCHMALITPPEPDAHVLVLQAKATQARAKLKRWEKARNRIPDYREMQANDDTKDE